MAVYTTLFNLVKNYFVEIGFNPYYVNNYFSDSNFQEILSIRLANANVVIKNKTDRNSHQTHIAITGEAIEFFYKISDFSSLNNETIDKRDIEVYKENIDALAGRPLHFEDELPKILKGSVTIGKRTQKQVQFSKRNRENDECINELRNCLYENDLLILLKHRNTDVILAIGIPESYYSMMIPDYSHHYETNTYLRIPKPKDE